MYYYLPIAGCMLCLVVWLRENSLWWRLKTRRWTPTTDRMLTSGYPTRGNWCWWKVCVWGHGTFYFHLHTVFACRMARCCSEKNLQKKKKGLTTCLLFMCFIWSRHLGGHHFKHSTHLWLERLDYILVMNVDTVRNSKSHELFLHTSTNNASTNLCAQILTYIKFTHEFFYHYRGRCTCMICFL